jgi:hypothetical protein
VAMLLIVANRVDDFVHQRCIFDIVKHVPGVIGLEASERSHDEALLEMLGHHVVVLGRIRLSVESAWMAEKFASDLESGLVDSQITLGDKNDNASLVPEL